VNEVQILALIHDSWLGEVCRSVTWLFPTFETLHFIGLTTLIGAMMIVDLRLIGMVKIPMKSALRFTHVAFVGFALNVISGVGCFASNPSNYYHNPSFRLKMLLILLAGLNLVYFEVFERRKVLALGDGVATGLDTKIVAGLSLTLWTLVIILGRFLPVTALGGG
jgi:hypothetical protein